jgi:ribosomal-protein-alanine N-acetyltransferase
VTTDLSTVRKLLERDRFWTAYAIGDLDPRRAAHCDWYVSGDSLALLYREFETPILFASGDPEILQTIDYTGPCYLQIPRHFELRQVEWSRAMHRMGLDPAEFRRPTGSFATPLGVADEPEIRELFADGRDSGEEPDFFMTSQLGDGTFFGVRDESGRLVAAGGTHLYSDPESVATIGNIYTHRAYRGRGHAKTVTAAIVETVLERGIRTVVLNVKSQNTTAIRIYEQLGFRFHCVYWEGFATNLNKN